MTSAKVTTKARKPGPPLKSDDMSTSLTRLSCLIMSSPQPEDDSPAIPRLSARTWAWVAAGLALLTAGTVWYALQFADEPVRWQDVGFSVESPTEATATYDVYLYDDTDAECTVRALNQSFAEVGVATQRVSLADGEQQRVTTRIVTTEVATTATVQGCVPVE